MIAQPVAHDQKILGRALMDHSVLVILYHDIKTKAAKLHKYLLYKCPKKKFCNENFLQIVLKNIT